MNEEQNVQALKIGQILRYGRPYSADEPEKDGLPNYFYVTRTQGEKLVLLESGINPIAKVPVNGMQRCPAIAIRSSPHKIGSEETPWQDQFNVDVGHIRYFGDAKPGSSKKPELNEGNKALLAQFELYSSNDPALRSLAAPLVFFRSVPHAGGAKGAVMFEGFGIIEKVGRISQYDAKSGGAFTNYVYDVAVMDMSAENEVFFWYWVSARRNSNISASECLRLSPKSWQRWIRDGSAGIEVIKRRVSKLQVTKAISQQPENKKQKNILEGVYKYYEGKKSRFEALAALVAARVIKSNGASYIEGWVTKAGSDGGADFIGRLDVGSGFSVSKVIVLGQAKCEKLSSPTGGNHIARTVARLKRGWIGVYVTTSYFSESVQREVIEDNYPIILVNGKRVAEEILNDMHERGILNLQEYLAGVDSKYEECLSSRVPEEILSI